MVFPKRRFCLQGLFWCHGAVLSSEGTAVTGLGCSSFLPPRPALGLDPSAVAGQALVV